MLDLSKNRILEPEKLMVRLRAFFFLPKHLFSASIFSANHQSDTIQKVFDAPDAAKIIQAAKWSALNNAGASFLITNATGDSIFDRSEIRCKMASSDGEITAGVSLERINPFITISKSRQLAFAASSSIMAQLGFTEILNSGKFPLLKFLKKWVWIEAQNVYARQ